MKQATQGWMQTCEKDKMELESKVIDGPSTFVQLGNPDAGLTSCEQGIREYNPS